jgi:hypothetical protein
MNPFDRVMRLNLLALILLGISGCATGHMPLPTFPWPPPTPSASMTIPIKSFQTPKTYGQIAAELGRALDSKGYVEKSYYLVPNGFAIVTRMERIFEDGRSFTEPDRWIVEGYRILSLDNYFQSLFRVDKGYFRIVTFVVTDQPFAASASQVTSKSATRWLHDGANYLPQPIAGQRTPRSAQCTVLIYEFVKQHNADPVFDLPSLIGANQHVTGTGVLNALSITPGGSK